MMENAKEALSHNLLSKKDKCIQNTVQQSGKKDHAMHQNSVSDGNDDFILERSFNRCCFCTKVFQNSKFLIKHILRRHSEDLVVMCRKLNDLNMADVKGHFCQNDIMNIITSEFSKLKSDLEFIKSSVSGYKSDPNFCHDSSVKESNDSLARESFASVSGKVNVLTTELQALKVTSAKIETDISDLKAQWNECGVKSFCNSLNPKNTLIYHTLKDDLLLELQNLISENNGKLEQNVNQLSLNFKADIEGLEHLININLEKIDTSTLVQETMRSLEKEIEFFFSCHKAKKLKSHASELNLSEGITPKVKKVKPNYSHETVNFSTSGEKPLLLENKLNNHTCAKKSFCVAHKAKKLKAHGNELNLSKEINGTVKDDESNLSQERADICTEFENRLRALNVPTGTKRLSNTDYSAKLKLVESERGVLSKKYQSFSDVYRSLNSSLDTHVSQKLKADKKSRKIRFSLTPKLSCENVKTNAEDRGIKLAERISDSPEECIGGTKSTSANITPIIITDMESVNRNSSSLFNSAASLKLISSPNKKRKLPSVPSVVPSPNEPSPYESLESDF